MTQEQLNRRMDSFGNTDFTIPEIKLIQNVGGDEAKQAGARAGDFYIPMMGEIIPGDEGLDVVLVDMQKTRTYWGHADINDEPPTCASLDAETFLSQNGDDCRTCEFFNEAPWLLDATKRRAMCLINYNLLVFRALDMMPLLVRTSGISTQAARNLLTSFRLNRQLAGEYHRVIVHIGRQKKKTASGEAFAFVFTPKGRVNEPELLEQYREQSASLLGAQIALPAGREEEAAQLTQGQAPIETSEQSREVTRTEVGWAPPEGRQTTITSGRQTTTAPAPKPPIKKIDTNF